MRIAVTGVTSFIGKAFVNSALNKGWDILAVVRKASPELINLQNNNDLQVLELSMEDYLHFSSRAGKIDCLVHFAWNGTRGSFRADEELQKSNYENSVNLINAAIENGCKKILTAGSQAEYGLCNGLITEETICNPNTAYGYYKNKLYETTKIICSKSDVSYKEPRIFSVYGSGDYEKTLIMTLIQNMSNNQECKITDCIQMWDYLYIKDAVSAMIGLCEKVCSDGAYDLGSGDVRCLRDYVEELKLITHSSSKILYGAVPYPDSGMVSIYPSIKKIKSEIKWKPKYTFEQGIKEMILL